MKHVFLIGLALCAPAIAEIPTLINGRSANPADFPASVWTRSCSATVVGPRVVFIAAHCVSSGRISFAVGPTNYTASCLVSREYSRNATADYALCLTDKRVEGISYENLNADASRLKVGGEVLLTGYGCVRSGGGGGNDGTYRIGEATITRLPSGSNNDIVTQKGAALCFGDSGGPAFLYLEAGNSMARKRVVISTNSRGDIATTSYLSSTATPEAQRFFKSWSEKTGEKICGVHAETQGCRNAEGGGSSDPDPRFAIAHPVANLDVTVSGNYLKDLDLIRSELVRLLDELR